MPTPTRGPRLGGSPAHQRLILANLATQLFEHGGITTTVTKAKRVRPLAERMVTFAKRGDIAARRRVLRVVRDKSVVHTLFTEIGPRYDNRNGGYTRIVKLGPRKGDNAPMARIELVEALTAGQSVVGEAEQARSSRFASRSAPGGRTREVAEELAAESPTAAAVAGTPGGAEQAASEDAAPAGIPGEGGEVDQPNTTPAPVDVPAESGTDLPGAAGEEVGPGAQSDPGSQAEQASEESQAEGER